MANYFEMSRKELAAEKAKLEESYKKFQDMGLKLNMARGKPGPHQMDLAMGLLQMTDYTTDAGTDARNYGDLEGLHEARELFADVMGVKPEEVFVGGNSSLQLMYNLISMGYSFGFPESPCPWSQVPNRKFLCPVPGSRTSRITRAAAARAAAVQAGPAFRQQMACRSTSRPRQRSKRAWISMSSGRTRPSVCWPSRSTTIISAS